MIRMLALAPLLLAIPQTAHAGSRTTYNQPGFSWCEFFSGSPQVFFIMCSWDHPGRDNPTYGR
jgi:hypothetical protein